MLKGFPKLIFVFVRRSPRQTGWWPICCRSQMINFCHHGVCSELNVTCQSQPVELDMRKPTCFTLQHMSHVDHISQLLNFNMWDFRIGIGALLYRVAANLCERGAFSLILQYCLTVLTFYCLLIQELNVRWLSNPSVCSSYRDSGDVGRDRLGALSSLSSPSGSLFHPWNQRVRRQSSRLPELHTSQTTYRQQFNV